MSNKFSNKTQVNLRPKVCKSPPPPPHPEEPTPPVPNCLASVGTLVVGVSPNIVMTPFSQKPFLFLSITARTYQMKMHLVAGANRGQSELLIDTPGCCVSGQPGLLTFSITLPGTSPLLAAQTYYLICIANKLGTNTYTIEII